MEKQFFMRQCILGAKKVEFLISHGANINEKDKDGETALHIATLNNSKETA